MKVAFITEAENKIGYGHLYRCIALAQEFIDNNCDVDFYYHNTNIKEILNNLIPEANSYTTSALTKTIKDYNFVIIDVYKNSWQNYLWITQVPDIKSVCVIDYIFREFSIPSDFIFEVGFQEYPYKKTIKVNESGTISTIYSGNDFFIFRKEFKDIKPFEVKKIARNILITMGGSDPFMLSEQVAKALETLMVSFHINYIFGAGFENSRINYIKSIHRNSIHKIEYIKNTKKIANIISQNDIAIINGGNTRFELSALGIPFISIAVNKTQFEISKKISNAGIGEVIGEIYNLSRLDISKHIYQFSYNYSYRQQMSKRMREVIRAHAKSQIFETLIN
jgi:spore coat polysaccharide biosynthesis predicted glycosyltransferase SpsG